MITLKKQKGKDFVILNLTDVQLCESQWDASDRNYDNAFAILDHTVRTLLARVKPDLITITGDISSADQKKAYPAFADYIDQFGVPWALVWGNHDQQEGMAFIDEVLKYYFSCKNFIHENGDPALGNGNYVIAIEQEGKLVEGLLMMDSHNATTVLDENGEPKFAYDKLNAAQLDWYRKQIALLKGRGCDQTAMFLHIPIYAYRLAYQAAFPAALDPKAVTLAQSYGADCWNAGYEDSFGVAYEEICSYPLEDGVFDVVQELHATQNIIAGHDHTNNWVVNYEGVRFIYATKTGKGCYWYPEVNGGTVLRVDENGVCEVRHEYVDVKHLL